MKFLIIIIILLLLLYIISNNRFEPFTNEVAICTSDETFRQLSFISYVLTINNIKHWLSHNTLLESIKNKDIKPSFIGFELGSDIENTDKLLALSEQIDYDGYHFRKSYTYDKVTKKPIWDKSLRIYFKGIPVGVIYLYKNFKDGLIEELAIGKIKYNFFPIPKQLSSKKVQ